MIPKRITLEGIYSYKERVTIDFQPLLNAHLFGIFGAVGSGKSSLLEAITYCLYGQVERLNKMDNLAANLMNLEADSAYVELEYETLQIPGQYKTVVVGKRRKAGPEFKRSQFRWEAEEWIPVTDKDVEEAIGLSYDHFTRTVIIPQGKFQEFLQLTDAKRTTMLQELFRLDRFDLAYQVGRLKSQSLASKNGLQGQITSLTQIDLPAQEELAQRKKELTTTLAGAQKTLLFQKKRLEVAEKWMDLRARLAQKKMRHETDNATLADLVANLQKCSPALQEAAAAFEQLPHREKELEQLNQVARIQTLKADAEKLHSDYRAQETTLAGLTAEVSAAEISLQASRSTLDRLRQDSASLEEITSRQRILSAFRETKTQLEQLTTKGKDLRQQNRDAFGRLRQKTADLLVPLHLSMGPEDNPDECLPQWMATQRDRIALAQAAYDTRRNQAGLAPFADDLQDGQPCPLCGATDHPAPFHSKDHHQQLAPLKEILQAEIHKEDILREAANTWREGKHLQASLDHNLEQLREEYRRTEERHKSHQAQLAAWGVDDIGLERWLEVQIKKASEVRAAEEIHLQAEATHRKLFALQTEAKDQLARMHTRLSALEASIATIRENLDDALENAWRDRNQEDIVRHVADVEKALAEVRGHYTALQGQVQALEKDIHTRKALLIQLEGDMADLEYGLRAAAEELKVYVDPAKASQDTDDWQARLDSWATESAKAQELVTRTSGDLRVIEEQLRIHHKNAERLAALQVDLDAIHLRLTNIQALEGLFRGKGMVEFAAMRYLDQIIQLANERFIRMTRHKLRMELQEGRIMVRDYYHGGAMRLIKTLSGGQLFQASLCLALAMASTIRVYREGAGDFFFLDEGFGTQDAASLDLVLQTLKDLRAENRSVGLISHVEALKQEVGAYLTIHQDALRGSVIQASF